MKNMSAMRPLFLALMLAMLLSLTACSEIISLVTTGGNSEMMLDPAVTPTTVPLTPTAVPPTEEVEADTNQDISSVMETNNVNIIIGDRVLTATLVENSSTEALKAALSEGPITVDMRDYGSMEKVGSLGMDLPRNDQQITTAAGDIILYQGGALVIYYAPNSWNFARLGRIDDITAEDLRAILGTGDVTVTLSLPQE